MYLVVVDAIPVVMIAVGMTFLGLFSPYRIFLFVAIGPIMFLMFEYEALHEGHEGIDIIITSLAAWALFNIVIAVRLIKNA